MIPSDFLKKQILTVGLNKALEGSYAAVTLTIIPKSGKPRYRSYRLYAGDEINVGERLFGDDKIAIDVWFDWDHFDGHNRWLGASRCTRSLRWGDKLVLSGPDPLITLE